ncbi:MAG: hypothetical protein BV458_11440 [Thermoplasmata archaeon M9B2D]|nr:MAG: hypothetical protein BV458_11440 [Thermoplasmata archaeon M9B2D]
MPVKVKKVKGGYRVSTPHGTKAKKTTKKKAEAQKRLLNAVEHGWKPTGKKKSVNRKTRRKKSR